MQKLVVAALITVLLAWITPLPVYKLIYPSDRELIMLIKQVNDSTSGKARDKLTKYLEAKKK